jgi:hypothetical protein
MDKVDRYKIPFSRIFYGILSEVWPFILVFILSFVFAFTLFAATTTEPVALPIDEPVALPIDEPVALPIDEPVALPIDEPVALPIDEPVELDVFSYSLFDERLEELEERMNVMYLLQTITNDNWSLNYNYRVKIVASSSKVSGAQTNIPLFFNLENLNSNFWNHVNLKVQDLYMTNATGSRISLELVSVSSSTKKGELYFKAPYLSSATGTVFYLYYGSSTSMQPAAAAAYGSNDVWSNNYAAVWHAQSISGITDSTGKCAAGTNYNVSISTSGQLGNAWLFNSTSDYITVPAPATGLRARDLITAAHAAGATWSFWVKPSEDWDGLGGRRHVITKGINDYGSNRQEWAIFQDNIDDKISNEYNDGGFTMWKSSKTSWTTNTWYYLTNTVLPSAKTFAWYVNGSSDVASSYATAATDFGDNPMVSIGHHYTDGELEGILDEVRISNVSRSSDWILTEYNNQKTNSTFFNIYGEENKSSTSSSEVITTTTALFLVGTRTELALNTGSNTPDLFIQFLLGALCAAALIWIFGFVLIFSLTGIKKIFNPKSR